MNIELTKYLPAFIHAAQALNFSAAARNLSVTPAAVSKNIKSLEKELGVRLFHRTTHSLTLTDDGERFFHKVNPIVQQLENVITCSQSLADQPKGKLRVSLPYGFGRLYIIPLVKGFRKLYPDVELDLSFEDRVVDLVEEGIDVAVGNRIDPDSSIVARQLCPLRLIAIASPEFIDKYGQPATPSELSQFECINYRSPTSRRLFPWRFTDTNGENITFETANTVVSVSSVELLCELAVQGAGISMAGTWLAKKYFDEGTLVPVLEKYSAEGPPIMIYYASRQNLPSKVRVFIDYVIENIEVPY
ncbi:LysR family transcriptional regulator [Vibrio sp. Of7-15]|uniref:LysR family transcriptional regulator n=1 Tax=Vibrio sp. Of7-15 TaxID=2724879 RepID=UPI001EF2B0D7|nr:LysR family transcriptional regulator [Vibrio sp. Of7-15]MCG7496494.1 LysR family transcriptional regulator [Vibrio sp. Of7-15]